MWNYTEFEVEKEDWNILELKDGSLIKTKFVLIALMKIEEEKRMGFDINALNAVGVLSPPEKRGPPSDRDYSPEELKGFIVDHDLSFKVQKEGLSEYRLQDGSKFSVKLIATQVLKTEKFDMRGNPIYLLQTTIAPKFVPAKK